MRKSFLLLIATAATFTAAAPALAQQSPGYSWAGPYIGAQIGGAWGNESDNWSHVGGVCTIPEGDVELDAICPEGPPLDAFSTSGVSGGVFVGYNWQTGPWVEGFEGHLDWTGLNGSKSSDGDTLSFNTNIQGSVRSRLGYAVNDNLLVYLDAGLAFANAQASANGYSADGSHIGWTAGAGLEYAIDEHWAIRGEVQYASFGGQTYNIDYAPINMSWNQTTATIGISYKF